MQFISRKSSLFAIAALALLHAPLLEAAEEASAIVFVADSRGLSGWRAWCTNLYNENLLYFALLTVALIPALAMVLGSITGFFLRLSGINLKSRVLAEH